jgi:hypothetical protein
MISNVQATTKRLQVAIFLITCKKLNSDKSQIFKFAKDVPTAMKYCRTFPTFNNFALHFSDSSVALLSVIFPQTCESDKKTDDLLLACRMTYMT